jgi:hypothetical protein
MQNEPRRNLYLGTMLALLGGLATAVPATAQPKAAKAGKRLLKPADFEYVGSFAPPLHPTGDWKEGQTAYSMSGLAMRKVDGEIHFFHAAQPDGRLLYEMVFPGLAISDTATQKWPRAKVVKTWRNWYKQVIVSGNTAVHLRGLFWDEERQGLWWNYANTYNVVGKNDPCFGFTELKESGPVIHGPWRAEGDGANSHRCQGGMTRIPAWFASKYAGGNQLALGFGGTFSGSASGSYGPTLFAAALPKKGPPAKGSAAVQCRALLNYPAPTQFCIRDPDYKTEVKWSKNPQRGVGFWTTGDHLGAGGIWIDLPDAHGLVFFPQLAHGKVAYIRGGTMWEGASSDIFIYNPADLVRVAQGRIAPWNVKPAHMARFPYVGYKDGSTTPAAGDQARAVMACGCCLDVEARTLYVLVVKSYSTQGSNFPLVHAFKIN